MTFSSKSLIAALVLASGLAFTTVSHAAQPKNEEDCDGSTAEMHECIGKLYEKADKELNTYYKELRAKIAAADTSSGGYEPKDLKEIDDRLVAAQRAWITFRDADCSLQGTNMLRGTGEGLIIHGCLFRKTAERVKELKMYQIF